MRHEREIGLPEFGFIPNPLEVKGRPELKVFPQNILVIQSTVAENNKILLGDTLYVPNLETFSHKDRIRSLDYLNEHSEDYYWNIRFHDDTGEYEGRKFHETEILGLTVGSDWKSFFIKMGSIGLTEGEPCYYTDIEI